MDTKRILDLADLIEKQPHTTVQDPAGFNMRRWQHTCGTPCCIAGWAAHVSVDGKPIDEHSVSRMARKWLGLDLWTAEMLFEPDGMTYANWGHITPVVAARTLRHLAKTGKVIWSLPTEEEGSANA